MKHLLTFLFTRASNIPRKLGWFEREVASKYNLTDEYFIKRIQISYFPLRGCNHGYIYMQIPRLALSLAFLGRLWPAPAWVTHCHQIFTLFFHEGFSLYRYFIFVFSSSSISFLVANVVAKFQRRVYRVTHAFIRSNYRGKPHGDQKSFFLLHFSMETGTLFARFR